MGRHSAPDDDAPSDAAGEVAVLVEDPPDVATGRHAVLGEPDVERESPTEVIAPVADDAATDPVEKPVHGVRADLHLVRSRPVVLLYCVLAVLVAFGGYAAIMAGLGRTADFLTWLWTPVLVAGVLVGLVLDLAHRRAARAIASTGGL